MIVFILNIKKFYCVLFMLMVGGYFDVMLI